VCKLYSYSSKQYHSHNGDVIMSAKELIELYNGNWTRKLRSVMSNPLVDHTTQKVLVKVDTAIREHLINGLNPVNQIIPVIGVLGNDNFYRDVYSGTKYTIIIQTLRELNQLAIELVTLCNKIEWT
jgi:hypothetical protein